MPKPALTLRRGLLSAVLVSVSVSVSVLMSVSVSCDCMVGRDCWWCGGVVR